MLAQELKNGIIEEVKLLEHVDDCVGINIGNNKGLFIQVVNYGDGKTYLIELNNIDENGCYEPCREYNAVSEFGNIEELIKVIEDYITV